MYKYLPVLISLGFVVLLVCTVRSATIHVPADQPTIQAGIDASINWDTVAVASGTYVESINFGGRQIRVKSTDGPLLTIITADVNDDLVVFNNSESTESILEGFTLFGGRSAIWCQNSSPTIRGNLLLHQGVKDWAAICLGGIGWGTIGYSPAVIENNTIVGSNNGAVSTFSTEAPVIRNNIIAYNEDYGMHRRDKPEVAQPYVSYNNVYLNFSNYHNIPADVTGEISADPRFNSNYSLKSGSPCLDSGDPNPIYNDPDGSRGDMGPLWGAQAEPILDYADTIRVPADYPTIQQAIDQAIDNSTVLVSPGTYEESLNFQGKRILLISTDGPQETTITDISSPALVSFVNRESVASTLEGFTLLGGQIGVLCNDAGPALRRMIIRDSETAKNCIVAFNTGFGLSRPNENWFAKFYITYDNVFGNTVDYRNMISNYYGMISEDPMFNIAYGLRIGSPCLDAGDPDPRYNDHDGTRNDMGAIQGAGGFSFLCGDADGNRSVNWNDVEYLRNYYFYIGQAPEPLGAGDPNCDGRIDISDLVHLAEYLMGYGREPCCLEWLFQVQSPDLVR